MQITETKKVHIFYRPNPKDTSKKTVRTNIFSKIAGYKMNVQKSAAYLYVSNNL